ncbi:MAG: hypothetical protein Phog2KO_31890 [Phototrophicaceae bacterium]
MRISKENRQTVFERAKDCCEYCHLAQKDDTLKFHVDHVIARKHGGNDALDNLCLACYRCNSFKGSNVAAIDSLTGNATRLFHPRKDEWEDHFRLIETGIIKGLSPEGRVTISVLRINDITRIQQRLALIDVSRYPCKDT